MDTISRQAAIDALKEHRKLFCDNTPKTFRRLPYHEKCRVDEIDTAIATLVNLPSAQPEWIPCSKTVDIPDHEILACDQYGEEMFGYLGYEDEQWMCASEECVMYDPIAWCEKPEPYKERREE